MASHDAIPHDTIKPGTTLYQCEVSPGEVVVVYARRRFRAARVIRVGPEDAYLIYPAAHPDQLPHQPTRPRTEIYALVGTEVARVVCAGEKPSSTHSLIVPHQPQSASQDGGDLL